MRFFARQQMRRRSKWRPHVTSRLRARVRVTGLYAEHLEERLVLSVSADDELRDDAASETAHPKRMSCGCPSCAIPEPSAFEQRSMELPATAQFPLADTFRLHSLTSATKRIYLDFDGHYTANTLWQTYWNYPAVDTPAYSLDSNYAAFSDTELTAIQNIWARVAEDFAPFQVDVTTEVPTDADLINSGGSDSRWGVRVVVGGDGAWMGSAGVAISNGFGRSDLAPAFAFADQWWKTNYNFVAGCISHEVGHTLGLDHDGYNGSEYYGGRANWGPLMGNPDRLLTQWSNGDYTGATNTEDDLLIITTRSGNGFGYRTDDHGSTTATASQYLGVDIAGIIERNTDVDVFRFFTSNKAIIDVTPASIGANLDVLAEILDSAGTVVASSNPVGVLSASFNTTLAPGTYFLRVQGTGEGSTASTGYSRYGSLGQYTVSMEVDAEPRIAVVTDRVGSIQGTVMNGGVTDDAQPVVSGVGSPGAVVTVKSGTLVLGSGTIEPDGAWSCTVASPLADGVYPLTVQDSLGGISAAPYTIVVDTAKPTVSVTRVRVGALKIGDTDTIAFTLSEPSTTFTIGDVTVSGGTLSGFTGSGTSYSATFTPDATFVGTAVVAVAGGSFTDPAGNPNAAATPLAIPVDTVPPTVTVTRTGTGTLKIGDTTVVTFTLSEPSTTFTAGDVAVSGGTLSGFSGSGTSYSATFAPTAEFAGTATISVAAGAFADIAGNANDTAGDISIAVDTVAPTITGFRATPATARLGIGGSLVIEADMSEAVTPSATFTVRLGSGGRVRLVTNESGLRARGTYVARAGEYSEDLDVVSIISGGQVRDAAGNALLPSLPPAGSGLAARHQIVVDARVKFIDTELFSTDPTLVRDAQSQFRQIPLRFSTPVHGLSLDVLRLSVEGVGLSLQGATLQGSGAEYLLALPVSRVNPIGIYTLAIAPGGAVRAVSNGAAAAEAVALHWGFQRSVGMVPDAPSAVKAERVLRTVRRTSVVLTWLPPAGNGGGTVSQYTVHYRLIGDSRWTALRTPISGAATSATIDGLAAGGTYEFRVSARNAAGSGRFGTSAPFLVN